MRNLSITLLISFVVLLFIVNPTIGTISMLFYMFVANKKENAIWTMAVLLLYIWCFQSTRSFNLSEPMDWANGYYTNFHNVGGISAYEYVAENGPEYFWAITNLVGYYLFNGNFLHFAFVIVVLTYLFTFLSIYYYWKDNNNDFRTLLSALVLIAFFSEFIELINNLLRQQFAFSIMLLVIVKRITTGRINWCLLAISFLTHTMVLFFVPFLYLDLKRRFNVKQYLKTIVPFLILYIIFNNLHLFSTINLYAFQRLASASTHQLEDVMSVEAIYPFLGVMVIFYLKAFMLDKRCEPNRMYFNHLMIVLMGVCLMMTHMPLMQTRYYILRLFLLPFILPYFFKNIFLKNIYQGGVCLFFTIRFFSYNYYWFNIDDVLSKNLFQFNLLGII